MVFKYMKKVKLYVELPPKKKREKVKCHLGVKKTGSSP